MEVGVVEFKSAKSGISIHARQSNSFEEIVSAIKAKLEKSQHFFKGTSLHVNICGKDFDDLQKKELSRVVKSFLNANKITFEPIEERQPTIVSNVKDIMDDIEHSKFHRKTVRSGQLVQAYGNLVVIGDVNPGAEIVATGDIIVLGALKGIVHAGCSGNRDSIVFALELTPTQLRIADIITRPPDEDVRRNILPEYAYVKDGTIYIDSYSIKKIM